MKELKLFQQAQFKLISINDMADIYKHTNGYTNDNNVVRGTDENLNLLTNVQNEVAEYAEVEKADPTEIYIEGYASVFINNAGDRLIDREGQSVDLDFLKLDSYLANPVLNYNHDFNKVVGRVISVTKNDKGIFVQAVVHKLTGQEYVFELVQKGLLRAFSIGFIVKSRTFLDDNSVEISEAELIEISLAGTQANQEALFNVIGQKSMSVQKKLLAAQNGMTCNELDASCNIKTKGMNMEQQIIEPTPVTEQKVVAADVEQKVVEQAPAINEAALVEAITNAQIKAEQIKADKLVEIEAAQKLEEAAKVKAESDRVTSATNYIKEQTARVLNTPDADIDLDSFEAFYSLISESVEAIENKVTSAVKTSLKSV